MEETTMTLDISSEFVEKHLRWRFWMEYMDNVVFGGGVLATNE